MSSYLAVAHHHFSAFMALGIVGGFVLAACVPSAMAAWFSERSR